MTRVENEKLGIVVDIPPITQRILEEYYRLVKDDPARPADHTTAESWAATTRAAIKLGWLNGVKADDIQEWLPAKTRFVAITVGAAILEATEIPKV